MVKIENLEEKKRIIAFYICLYNKYPKNKLCNSRIYDVWLRMWKDDFVVDGKCLKMWHQKIVESVAKHKHHVEPPAYYAEYNDLINSVTDFVNENYNPKLRQGQNKQHCEDMLHDYRKECEKELALLLEANNCCACTLSCTNSNSLMQLAQYQVKQDDQVVCSGTYDSLLQYLKNM